MNTVIEKQGRGFGDAVSPVLIGILSAFIVSIVFLGVFSLIMTFKDVPAGALQVFTCVAIGGGSLAGGFITARLYRSKGLILGAVTGLCFFLALLVIGMISRQVGWNGYLLLKFILSLAFGAAGGVGGVNARRRRAKI